ncbi:hypothetical protein BGX23_001027 [Mortierella sp. AD031]|nr:hypothetical protein BGX23_001027 [Mortierella sp. AD031]
MESILEQPAAHLPSVRTLDQTSLHLLPCGIQYDGRANIQGFFFLVDGQYQSPSTDSTTTATATTTTTITSETTTSGDVVAITSEATTTTVKTSTTTGSGPTPPEASFRGRSLKGTVMTVPEGYIGTIYKSTDNYPGQDGINSNNNTTNGKKNTKASQDMDMDEDEEYEAMLKGMQEERKVMRAEAQFREWMFWGHDDQPTARTDKVVRAMQWIDIANVLHQPHC